MKKSLKMAAVVGLTLSALYTSAKVGDKASVASLLPDGLINPGSGDQIGDFPSSSKKSVPATKSNGFVGKLADGRPVEVLQICRMLPNKSFQAWKPDGTPLAPDKSNPLRLSPLSFRGPNVRCIFLRFKGTPQNPMPTSGCHKLLDNGNEANQNEKGFLGSEYYFLNGGFAAYQDGYYTTATFFTLNKTSGKAFSARFGVQDTGWTDLGPIKRSDPKFNNVNIMEVRGPLEVELEYYPWWTQHPAPYTMLQFEFKLSNYLPMFPNVSDNTRGNLQVVPVFRKSGLKDELSNRMYSPGVSSIVLTPTTHKLVSFRSKYYFAYRTTDIKEFRIVRRNLLGCDLLKVAVNPNR